MTALEDWQDYCQWTIADDTMDKAEAAIHELEIERDNWKVERYAWEKRATQAEAELAALKENAKNWGTLMHEVMDERDALKASTIYDDAGDHVQTWEDRAHALEAELAALKARRCETCDWLRVTPEFGGLEMCHVEAAISGCDRWQPREEPT